MKFSMEGTLQLQGSLLAGEVKAALHTREREVLVRLTAEQVDLHQQARSSRPYLLPLSIRKHRDL